MRWGTRGTARDRRSGPALRPPSHHPQTLTHIPGECWHKPCLQAHHCPAGDERQDPSKQLVRPGLYIIQLHNE